MRYYSCCCGQCRIHALQGPVLLITAGLLFALDFIWGRWEIGRTWPVLLIVLGLFKLIERLAPDSGHGFAPAAPPSEVGERGNAT